MSEGRVEQERLDGKIEELDRKVMQAAGEEYRRYRSAFNNALPTDRGAEGRLVEGSGLITVVKGLLNEMRIRGGGMDGLITPKQKADVLARVRDPQLNIVVDSAAGFIEKVQQDKSLPGYGLFRAYDSYLIKASQEAIEEIK